MTPDDRALDLDAYFNRIGWRGAVAPDYGTLARLLDAHVRRIPFENIDVLLGRPVRLDLAGLQAKFVDGRRGGYCFEHATLFAAVLDAVGFAPVRHAARVVLFQPREASPRTHMFLTAEAGGARYVVDPGFGPFGCAVPLPLTGGAVPAAAPTHRLMRQDGEWTLMGTRNGAERPCWMTTLEVENPADFVLAKYYIATHPASAFTQQLMASAVTPDGRVNIFGRDVTQIRDGVASATRLPDRTALRAMLAADFGFDLPEVEDLRMPAVAEWA